MYAKNLLEEFVTAVQLIKKFGQLSCHTKKELPFLRESKNLHLPCLMLRKQPKRSRRTTGQSWRVLRGSGTMAKLEESYYHRGRTDDQRKSTVAARPMARWVTLSCVCPHCHRFPLEETSGGSLGSAVTEASGRNGASGDARHAAASATGGTRTEFWLKQDGADPSEAKVFRAHAPPHGACGNFVCTLKLLANMEVGGELAGAEQAQTHR